ncbi:DNA-binding transcriptional LysR family regulator [Erwinia toletana]|uniref:DNA-binding transcriptional LysR family regulator n=1 Tax=Winslowiella toletana TaxID=92490 RepID=A0ABS4PF65_9GAMM|nr:LysR substrate-binding domain-containing protein [Winslowiella toletana]MBP2170797.1 DNA-binding transcriptional LysR family regulator [Winslowiella toletana]
MKRNLDITLLRTFVAVAEHASMTVAGNALHLTQSAISQQIARLEDVSGELFIRERKALRLTHIGERFLIGAKQIVALNDELWEKMSCSPFEGEVRMGAPLDLIGAWLPPILKAFSDAHPDANVKLVCLPSPDLIKAVEDGTLELAIVEEPVGQNSHECLNVERLVWVGAKGGTAHLKSPLPLSMVAETCAFRPVVLDALSRSGVNWRTKFESGNIEATCAMVRADLAITVWLESTVPNDLEIISGISNLPDLPFFAINLHLAKGEPSNVTHELIRHIKQDVCSSTFNLATGI